MGVCEKESQMKLHPMGLLSLLTTLPIGGNIAVSLWGTFLNTLSRVGDSILSKAGKQATRIIDQGEDIIQINIVCIG